VDDLDDRVTRGPAIVADDGVVDADLRRAWPARLAEAPQREGGAIEVLGIDADHVVRRDVLVEPSDESFCGLRGTPGKSAAHDLRHLVDAVRRQPPRSGCHAARSHVTFPLLRTHQPGLARAPSIRLQWHPLRAPMRRPAARRTCTAGESLSCSSNSPTFIRSTAVPPSSTACACVSPGAGWSPSSAGTVPA